MRILLIGNYLPDTQESMQRFNAALENGLQSRGHEVITTRPKVILGSRLKKQRGVFKWLGYADKFVLFPFALKKKLDWAEIVHICDHSNSLYVRYVENKTHVITCHDVLAIASALGRHPENPVRWTGREFQNLILRGLRRARHIVCVSEATKTDLLDSNGIDVNAVTVIHNGLNYDYKPIDAEVVRRQIEHLGIRPGRKYLLHVGGNQWYKNRLGLLKIYKALIGRGVGHDLVMVGKQWTDKMTAFVRDNNLKDRTIQLCGIANEDLRALYCGAELLLFPSLYEGFGWPIIEAQACGCPVVTSNRAPMKQVSGDAAVLVPPDDYEMAAKIIVDNWQDLPVLAAKGRVNAKGYETDCMIDKYVGLYQMLLGKRNAQIRE